MRLREAAPQDALLISQMIAASWRGAYCDLIDPEYLNRLPDEYWLPSMRTWLESGRMYGYIAEIDGEPVGCVIFGRAREESHAIWGEIVSLYVLPQHIGHGIGSALLSAAINALHAEGYTSIYLWALLDYRKAWRFYQRHGFRFTIDQEQYKLGASTMSDIRLVLEA